MIKLGCNAMLRVAEDLPYADKEDPRNWLDIAALVRQIRAWDLDVVDFQLFRGFRARDPAYLRSIKALCQQCGLPIGFFGRGPRLCRRRADRRPPPGRCPAPSRTPPAHCRSQRGH